MALSRPFVDYCIWGWDNLPRTILMYYSNFLSSPEGYFHTVMCNSKEFKNTTVNHDLHFISWDNPPKQHPHHLTVKDFSRYDAIIRLKYFTMFFYSASNLMKLHIGFQ
jgi:beta-glucuronosyltransferase